MLIETHKAANKVKAGKAWWHWSPENITWHLHSCLGGWSRPRGMVPRYNHSTVQRERIEIRLQQLHRNEFAFGARPGVCTWHSIN